MSRRFSKLMTFVLAICLLASLMTAGAFADENDTIIERALATSDKEAVVMRTAGEIAFTTSTTGASVSSVVWTDANGTTVGASDAFRQEVYTLTVTLTAGDGYVFAQNCSGYLYGKSCSIAVSADGKSVSLRRQIEPPVWSPIIMKHPLTEPPIEVGELAS